MCASLVKFACGNPHAPCGDRKRWGSLGIASQWGDCVTMTWLCHDSAMASRGRGLMNGVRALHRSSPGEIPARFHPVRTQPATWLRIFTGTWLCWPLNLELAGARNVRNTFPPNGGNFVIMVFCYNGPKHQRQGLCFLFHAVQKHGNW